MDISLCLGSKIAKILRLKRRFIDDKVKPLGLTRTQWQTLFWMNELGPCTQKDLLQQLDIDKGHLARVLEDFEKNHIITRSPTEADRRILSVKLTAKGYKRYIPPLQKILEEENIILTTGFSHKEENLLRELLDKMQKNLEKFNNDE